MCIRDRLYTDAFPNGIPNETEPISYATPTDNEYVDPPDSL